MKLSPIIQGCMKWGSWGARFTTKQYQEAIELCLESGITSFDHADIYGGFSTEAEFGKAWTQMNIPREKIQLISKCGIQIEHLRPNNKVKHYQYDANYIIDAAKKSIQDLECDYLDVFLLHRPSPLMNADEIEKAFSTLAEQNLVKEFGVSNFSIHEMSYLMKKVKISFNQIQLSLLHSEPLTSGIMEFMKEHEIQTMCWNPLGNYFESKNEKLKSTVTELAKKYNTDESGILVAWLRKIHHQILPVIGTSNKARMEKASTYGEIELQAQEWFSLWEAARDCQVP